MELLVFLPSVGRARQRGEIVLVRPNGHAWGLRERPPNFVVIRVPDSVTQGVDLTERATTLIPNPGAPEYPVIKRTTGPTLWQWDLDRLPVPQKTTLATTGVLDLSATPAWNGAGGAMRDQQGNRPQGTQARNVTAPDFDSLDTVSAPGAAAIEASAVRVVVSSEEAAKLLNGTPEERKPVIDRVDAEAAAQRALLGA